MVFDIVFGYFKPGESTVFKQGELPIIKRANIRALLSERNPVIIPTKRTESRCFKTLFVDCAFEVLRTKKTFQSMQIVCKQKRVATNNRYNSLIIK